MSKILKNLYHGIFFFLINVAFAQATGTEPTVFSIDLGTKVKAVVVEIRDADLLARLQKRFGYQFKMRLGKDENDTEENLKIYEDIDIQAQRLKLVSDLKEIVDDKAAATGVDRYSDLNTQVQAELMDYTSLKEQIALNWAEENLVFSNIKSQKLNEVLKLLNTDGNVQVSLESIKTFFCDAKSRVTLEECKKDENPTPSPAKAKPKAKRKMKAQGLKTPR